MFDVVKAYLLAKRAHRGQKDKAGRDYIRHPVYVAKHVKGRDAKTVALLHDVVEDTGITIEYIEKHFKPTVAEAVKTLTHDKSIDYSSYVSNIKRNTLATRVKVQDLLHNMNLKRLKVITVKDVERIEKYSKALQELMK